MNNIIYAFQQSRIYLKPLSSEGDFQTGSQKRYLFDVGENLDFSMQPFQLAFLQTTKKTSKMMVKKDKNRKHIIGRPKQLGKKESFYTATLCVIGMIAKLSLDKDLIDLKAVLGAVGKRNELWNHAIEEFNLFFRDSGAESFLRTASSFEEGRRAVACMLTGLQIICDLTKESRNLKLDGRFLDGAEVDNMLETLGLYNLDAYLLLYSHEHPDRDLLLKLIDKYDNKFELCKNTKDDWVLANKREIKRVEPINIKYFINSNQANTLPEFDIQYTEETIKENTSTNTALDSKQNNDGDNNIDTSVATSPETDQIEDEVIIADASPSHSLDDEIDDITALKSSLSNTPSPEETKTNTSALAVDETEIAVNDSERDDVDETAYSAERKRQMPSALVNQQKESSNVFKAPQNKNTIPIDIDNI